MKLLTHNDRISDRIFSLILPNANRYCNCNYCLITLLLYVVLQCQNKKTFLLIRQKRGSAVGWSMYHIFPTIMVKSVLITQNVYLVPDTTGTKTTDDPLSSARINLPLNTFM